MMASHTHTDVCLWLWEDSPYSCSFRVSRAICYRRLPRSCKSRKRAHVTKFVTDVAGD